MSEHVITNEEAHVMLRKIMSKRIPLDQLPVLVQLVQTYIQERGPLPDDIAASFRAKLDQP